MEKKRKKKREAVTYATLEFDPIYESEYFDKESIDICSKLLDKDAKKRLGALGCQQIKTHGWFSRIKLPMLSIGLLEPPYKPPRDVNALPQVLIGGDEEHPPANLDLEGQYDFKWTWTNPESFQTEVIGFLQHEKRLGGQPLLPQTKQKSECCSVS